MVRGLGEAFGWRGAGRWVLGHGLEQSCKEPSWLWASVLDHVSFLCPCRPTFHPSLGLWIPALWLLAGFGFSGSLAEAGRREGRAPYSPPPGPVAGSSGWALHTAPLQAAAVAASGGLGNWAPPLPGDASPHQGTPRPVVSLHPTC